MSVVNDYTALLSGSYWNGIESTGAPVIVTYSFPTTLPAYDASIPGITAASVTPFNAAEQQQAQAALAQWADASGLVFLQVAPGKGDINFQLADFTGTQYAGAGGIGFYPFGNWNSFSYPHFFDDLDAAGEVFMNAQDATGGTVNFGTLLHEIGHAIGLKHPTEDVYDSAAGVDHNQVLSSDDPARTIMATVGDGTAGGATHILALDQAAAAAIYGPAGTGGVYTTSQSGTNAVSNWSWDATTQTLTQTAVTSGEAIRGSSVDDVIHGSSGDDQLFGLAGDDVLDGGQGNDSLYGGSGTNTMVGGQGDDSYYVSSFTDTIIEQANQGNDAVYATVSFTLPENVESLFVYGQGLTATGNDQGGSLFGDGTYATTIVGGAGHNYIVGGAGDDLIEPGSGSDLMYGGGGADTFLFRSVADAPVGGALATIGDFSDGQDKIDLSAIRSVGGQPLTFIGNQAFTGQAGQVNETSVGGNTFIEGDINGDGVADFEIQLNGSHSLQASDFVLSPPCYGGGTMILTESGEVAVEDLAVGDIVMTASGECRPIAWIGHRRLDLTRHPDPASVWPVRVMAGAFGDGLPRRDLWLSPRHAVFVDDVLIPIIRLANGTTIAQVRRPSVTYWHIELPTHDILQAEGLPAESYIDCGNRSAFANGGDFIELHPDFAPKTVGAMCASLHEAGALVEAVKRRGLERAEGMGFPITADPLLRILADGATLWPDHLGGGGFGFMVPAGCAELRLVSRRWCPAHLKPESGDTRDLGVLVTRLEADGQPYDIANLHGGWLRLEGSAGHACRWTDGSAALPPGTRRLVVRIGGDARYWATTEIAAQRKPLRP